ncbi:MAG: hypothetical protein HQ519_08400 [Planctomycetes bacterium]|nr:hypothetical protein [Planctomycetota bacterium]
METNQDRVKALILTYRDELRSFIAAHAGQPLLRCETVDDLFHGLTARILKAGLEYEYQGQAEARGWVYRVTRSYLTDRARYWTALKRDSGKVLRFEASQTGQVGWDPAASQTSPSQYAVRREQVVLAARALDLLLERDRALMGWAAQGISTTEQAKLLNISYDAASQASHRAKERFRRVFALVASQTDQSAET